MITIGIKNTPTGTYYWTPVLYRNNIAFYPEDYLLPTGLWITSIPGGVADFRAVVYTQSRVELAHKDLNGINLVDGKTYIFDWATGTFATGDGSWFSNIPWKWVAIGIGIIVAIIAVAGMSKKKSPVPQLRARNPRRKHV